MDLRWGEEPSVLLGLYLYLSLYSKDMRSMPHFYVDGEIGRMMAIPRLFLHSATRITLLLGCDW